MPPPLPADTPAVSAEPNRSEPNDPERAARGVVTALLGATSAHLTPDDLGWHDVVSGGRIVQTAVLAQAADRATVAVSVAFDPTGDGKSTEPIGLRLDLVRLDPASDWTLVAIGYL